jgi:hypothetical protein
MVGALKELIGRGPTKAKTLRPRRLRPRPDARGSHPQRADDLRGGRRPGGGAGPRRHLGDDPQPADRGDRRNTDRKVVGFMSSSQQEPDLISFVFVLASSPLLELLEDEGSDD